MELNLYGIASIQLDRLKGTQIRKVLLVFAVYVAVSLASVSVMPSITYSQTFIAQDAQDVLKTQQVAGCLSPNHLFSNLKLEVTLQKSSRKQRVQSDPPFIQLNLYQPNEQDQKDLFTTDCNVQRPIGIQQKAIMHNNHIVLYPGQMASFVVTYGNDAEGLQMLVTVSAVSEKVYWQIALYKYTNIVLVLITIYHFVMKIRAFQYHDLGVVQKWVICLLCVLIMYDDPLYVMQRSNHVSIALFTSLLLFFWILVVHSIASTEQLLTLNILQFYIPKIVLCISILIALILRYPTVVTCLICVYLMYFGVIAFYVLRLSAKMKKSYKSLVQVTILVVTIALLLLIAKQLHTSILLIVAESSLYNGYMVLVAALYAPFIAPKTKTSREGEQDSIMQQFYELELEDAEQTYKRRDIKQDPAEKAKQKLWQSIVDTAEDSDDSDLDTI